jgi:hypothetical protein
MVVIGGSFFFLVWRIFGPPCAGNASVGAAKAALDAWAVDIRKLAEAQSKY